MQVEGQAGDIMLFTGLLQHAAMPNKSDQPRTGILLQYLPKCVCHAAHTTVCDTYVRLADVKPMEDLERTVKKEIQAKATPRMRQLVRDRVLM